MTGVPTAVVTALVDLAAGTPDGVRRSAADCLELAESLWPVALPMVVFCDEALVGAIAQRRAELAPG